MLHGKFNLLSHSEMFCISTIVVASVAAAILHHVVEVPIASLRRAIKS